MLPIGLQLYSLRDEASANLALTLEKVRHMGYTGIEFAGLYGHSAQEVSRLLEKNDLLPVSAHVPLAELLADPAGTVAQYKAIGCSYIAIPWLEEARRPGQPLYEQTLEQIRKIAEECLHQGLKLLYHNHDFEFTKLDGEYALDRMYATIPASLLQTELDTCWVRSSLEIQKSALPNRLLSSFARWARVCKTCPQFLRLPKKPAPSG